MLTGMISPALISLFVQRKTIGWLGILECWLEQFCIHPSEQVPDIIRIAWAALTACVDGK